MKLLAERRHKLEVRHPLLRVGQRGHLLGQLRQQCFAFGLPLLPRLDVLARLLAMSGPFLSPGVGCQIGKSSAFFLRYLVSGLETGLQATDFGMTLLPLARMLCGLLSPESADASDR